jgi:hypothetical protein
MYGSGLTDGFDANNTYYHAGGNGGTTTSFMQTPPPDVQFPVGTPPSAHGLDITGSRSRFEIDAWMELWDYAGGASFRAFIANDGGEKTLFVFFDIEGVMGRDLKKA